MENSSGQLAIWVTACVTILGVILTSLFAIIAGNKSRQNEHKLAVLKILLEASYKEYEFRTKNEIKEAKEMDEIPNIKSFTEYIIFYNEMSKLYTDKSITPEEIKSTLENNKKLIDSYYLNRKVYLPDYHKEKREKIKHL